MPLEANLGDIIALEEGVMDTGGNHLCLINHPIVLFCHSRSIVVDLYLTKSEQNYYCFVLVFLIKR